MSSAAELTAPWRRPAAAAAPALRARPRPRPALHTRTLANGVRLVVKEHHVTPLVSLRAATLGGLLLERTDTAGINNFLAGLVSRGSLHHTRESLGRAVESLAGTLEGFSGRNSFGLRGQFLSRHLEEGTDLFLEVLRHPTFPKDEIEKRRRELLIALSHRDDDPAQRALPPEHDRARRGRAVDRRARTRRSVGALRCGAVAQQPRVIGLGIHA